MGVSWSRRRHAAVSSGRKLGPPLVFHASTLRVRKSAAAPTLRSVLGASPFACEGVFSSQFIEPRSGYRLHAQRPVSSSASCAAKRLYFFPSGALTHRWRGRLEAGKARFQPPLTSNVRPSMSPPDQTPDSFLAQRATTMKLLTTSIVLSTFFVAPVSASDFSACEVVEIVVAGEQNAHVQLSCSVSNRPPCAVAQSYVAFDKSTAAGKQYLALFMSAQAMNAKVEGFVDQACPAWQSNVALLSHLRVKK